MTVALFRIPTYPNVVRDVPPGSGVHESVLRCYQTLQLVREWLADGVPTSIVVRVIDEIADQPMVETSGLRSEVREPPELAKARERLEGALDEIDRLHAQDRVAQERIALLEKQIADSSAAPPARPVPPVPSRGVVEDVLPVQEVPATTDTSRQEGLTGSEPPGVVSETPAATAKSEVIAEEDATEAQKATAPEGAVGSADTTPQGKPPTEDSTVAKTLTKGKELTDQAAQNGPGQPSSDSREPGASEKAATNENCSTPPNSTPTVSPAEGECASQELSAASRPPDSPTASSVGGEGAPVPDHTGPAPRQEEETWDGGALPEFASDVEVLGHYARFIDAEGNDVLRIGDVREPAIRALVAEARRRLAGTPHPRWGRVADPDAVFHLWPVVNDATEEIAAEAICGETTDANVGLLPEEQKPPAAQACLDCADLSGWTEPTQLSRPAEKQQAHGELPLSGASPLKACICGAVTFKGRQKKVVDGKRWHTRGICGGQTEVPRAPVQVVPAPGGDCYVPGCGEPGKPDEYGIGVWCAHHDERLTTVEKKNIRVARDRVRTGVPPEDCLAPGCGNEAIGKGIDAVCEVHQVADATVRMEWLLERYPELRPKAEKKLALKPKATKKRKAPEKPEGEAADG